MDDEGNILTCQTPLLKIYRASLLPPRQTPLKETAQRTSPFAEEGGGKNREEKDFPPFFLFWVDCMLGGEKRGRGIGKRGGTCRHFAL